jgi:hypothetical protein
MNELTDWFPPEIKPVRIGVYQRQFSNYSSYSWWNGKHFSIGREFPSALDIHSAQESVFQNKPWRGLSVKP